MHNETLKLCFLSTLNHKGSCTVLMVLGGGQSSAFYRIVLVLHYLTSSRIFIRILFQYVCFFPNGYRFCVGVKMFLVYCKLFNGGSFNVCCKAKIVVNKLRVGIQGNSVIPILLVVYVQIMKYIQKKL